jgi:hypothetical protein
MTTSIAAAAAATIASFALGWFLSRLSLHRELATLQVEPFAQLADTWRPGRPEAAVPPEPHAIYRPGAFLVSAELGAETWVVSDGER